MRVFKAMPLRTVTSPLRGMVPLQESMRVFKAMPYLAIHPLTTVLCLCGLAVWTVVVACFISTLSETSFEE